MSLRRASLVLLISLCLCVTLLLPAPRHANASSDPIAVTSQTYAIHFPVSLDFTISATDSKSTIYEAVIYLTIGNFSEQHVVNISKPLSAVTEQWHENTNGENFYPPGTKVDYYWQLLDSAGVIHTTPSQEFRTIDTRFTWQHLAQGLLQVNWYNRSLDFGQIMLNSASASIDHISQVLGGGLSSPINLWIYETPGDFQGSLAPHSYEWVGGQALPELNEASIAVGGTGDDTLIRDMPHELTHLVFHQLIGNGITPPTWFDEGLAVYNQVYHEDAMTQTFNKALAHHTLLRLDEMWNGFPANADKAYLAYAESWQLIAYMYSTFGQAKMSLLISKIANPVTDFDTDLKQAVGEDHLHLENSWRLHLNQPSILPADQLTPVPHLTTLSKQLQDGPDTRLIGIGIFLILGSLTIMMYIVINVRRRNKAAAEPMNTLQPNDATPLYPITDYKDVKDGSV